MSSVFEHLKAVRHASTQNLELKRLIADCDELIKERGQSVSVSLAVRAISRFRKLSPPARASFYDHLGSRYNPDLAEITATLDAYRNSQTADNLVRFVQASEPPRQEILRKINRAPSGTGVIVLMRQEILHRMKNNPQLRAADADFEHLLSSWFNPGFLELKKLDWKSPAYLLEQVIRHEAVHAIDGWSDLRRRLEPDRRLFAYFHPALPGEPLIFVEVALVRDVPGEVASLLDRTKPPNLNERDYKVATFYSISNCQPGLKGIHLGNFLIKRVAEELKKEFPALKTFCTLSPIPSLADFLTKSCKWDDRYHSPRHIQSFMQDSEKLLGKYATFAKLGPSADLGDLKLLKKLCAAYLAQTNSDENFRSDPVARFHLNNGATLDRINLGADLTPKGLRQSFGVMVNYRYELNAVEENHERFVRGEVAYSSEIKSLLKV
jgi:malonyl-CoA decarboxylase